VLITSDAGLRESDRFLLRLHQLADPPLGAEPYVERVRFKLTVLRLLRVCAERDVNVADLFRLVDDARGGERLTGGIVFYELRHQPGVAM
jgi:hypothetical protein